MQLLCVVLAGDARLPERFRSAELLACLESRLRNAFRLAIEARAKTRCRARDHERVLFVLPGACLERATGARGGELRVGLGAGEGRGQ